MVYAAGGARVGEAYTDQQGVATLALDQKIISDLRSSLASQSDRGSSKLNFYISAESQGDFALISTHDQNRVRELEDYGQYEADHRHLKIDGQWRILDSRQRGQVWSDRDLYRPGDTLYFGAALAQSHLSGSSHYERRCSLTLLDHNKKKFSQVEVKSSSLGTFYSQIKLPENAKLGGYQASVKCENTGGIMVWTRDVRVAEFRRPNFKVDAFASVQQALSGEEAEISVRGQYLYGAPMSLESWNVFLRADTYQPHFSGSTGSSSDIDLAAYHYGPPLHQNWGDTEVNAVLSEHYPQYTRYSSFNYEMESLSGSSMGGKQRSD